MSKITTVYDELLTILAAIFPEKKRIFNPYSLTDNPQHNLRDSYGLLKTTTDRVDAEFKGFTDSHGFKVVLTKEVVRMESQTDQVDDVHRELIEDAFELRERIYRYDKLGLTSEVVNTEIGSVSGVEQFYNEKAKFVSISIDFNILVNENFN